MSFESCAAAGKLDAAKEAITASKIDVLRSMVMAFALLYDRMRPAGVVSAPCHGKHFLFRHSRCMFHCYYYLGLSRVSCFTLWRIGDRCPLASLGSPAAEAVRFNAFRAELARLGYVEGKNLGQAA
jgi:hypothetical protein